jgi:hypothetical protein
LSCYTHLSCYTQVRRVQGGCSLELLHSLELLARGAAGSHGGQHARHAALAAVLLAQRRRHRRRCRCLLPRHGGRDRGQEVESSQLRDANYSEGIRWGDPLARVGPG